MVPSLGKTAESTSRCGDVELTPNLTKVVIRHVIRNLLGSKSPISNHPIPVSIHHISSNKGSLSAVLQSNAERGGSKMLIFFIIIIY